MALIKQEIFLPDRMDYYFKCWKEEFSNDREIFNEFMESLWSKSPEHAELFVRATMRYANCVKFFPKLEKHEHALLEMQFLVVEAICELIGSRLLNHPQSFTEFWRISNENEKVTLCRGVSIYQSRVLQPTREEYELWDYYRDSADPYPEKNEFTKKIDAYFPEALQILYESRSDLHHDDRHGAPFNYGRYSSVMTGVKGRKNAELKYVTFSLYFDVFVNIFERIFIRHFKNCLKS